MAAARSLHLVLTFAAISIANDDGVKPYMEVEHKHTCKLCMKYIVCFKITDYCPKIHCYITQI